jgi:hypothetical protein
MLRKLSAIALLTIAGCGLSDYESRMAATLAELQEKTRYESLFGPSKIDKIVGEAGDEQLVELPVTVRLPKEFGPNDWFRPGSVYRYRNEEVPDDVIYPPFLGEFPGLNRTAETYAEADERTFLAYYLYLGILESRSTKFEVVLADLYKKTAAKLKNTTKWQDVECKDEHLVPTKWKMLEAQGLQDFLNRSEQLSAVPGTFRIYAREDQGYIILLAVRIPNALVDKVSLLGLADAIAGTVRVTAPAPSEPEAPADAGDATPKTPETPAEKEPADVPPAESTPMDETPADAPPASDSPAESPAGEDPGDKTPADENLGDENPGDEGTAEPSAPVGEPDNRADEDGAGSQVTPEN